MAKRTVKSASASKKAKTKPVPKPKVAKPVASAHLRNGKVASGKNTPRKKKALLEAPVAILTQCPKNGQPVCEETIRVYAYHRWEAAGRPAGTGAEFWIEAERDLHQK